MLPALIFDLDGTLVDSLPGIATSLNHGLRLEGLEIHPNQAVRGFIGNGSYQLARKAIPDHHGDEVARTVEHHFKAHYARHWAEGTTLYPGIDGLIDELREAGRTMAILSNKPDAFTREIVARLFPKGPFEIVRGQIDGSARKPDPKAVLPLLEAWSIAPNEARFIGDSTVDMETAKAADIPFLGVAWGYHDPDYLGSEVAQSATDLRRRLL